MCEFARMAGVIGWSYKRTRRKPEKLKNMTLSRLAALTRFQFL